jgi:hypothetical protein
MNTRFDPQKADSRHPGPAGSPVTESATEARQGNKGTPVLKVLVAGLVLAFLAWGASEWWGEASDPPAAQTATPPAGETTPGNSGAAPTNDPVTQPDAPATNDRPSGSP